MIYAIAIVSLLVAMAATGLVFSPTQAQGQRLQGANGWLLPVASNMLSSDEHMHLRRGSVNAWDITAPRGSAIYPMAAGVVTIANCGNAGGFGCWVEVDHGGGYVSRYAHMITGSIRVSRGQQVGQWDVLGAVGWTGKTSFGPHVHWQIHHNGNRQRIDRFFNVAAMNKCDFCEATGDPIIASGTQAAPAMVERGFVTVEPMIPAAWVGYFVLLVFVMLAALLYLVGGSDNVLLSSFGTGGFMAALVALILFPLWLPMFTPKVTAAQAAPVAAAGNAWKIAYTVTRQWEGAKCVHDPGRTFKGVTQSTFDSWRRSQGQQTGDVCTSMTDAEAEVIYYQRYWLASGADKMPQGLAITHFDFAVNAGVGAARKALSACSTNVTCYNNYRERFYRSLKTFNVYGDGWINRLNSIRSVTQGKG